MMDSLLICTDEYNQEGLYDIDCGTEVPSLHIIADKIKFEIKSENLVVKLDNGKCLLGFLPMGSSTYGPSWHMGAVFTRQYCTIFDIGDGRIGFADFIRKVIEISTRAHTTPTPKPTARSTVETTSATKCPSIQTTTPNCHSMCLCNLFLSLLLFVGFFDVVRLY
ncbi:hypothetical protein Y032_0006g3104 [Ancylostoma ceylanicum]|uniref:Peptidase A1 domain-containing protein n=2 Tax=Ancylostoma ceylanicum TaxID=53326 RepID=A0A016VRJ7_9BILA|nr:hypothetical protein Y032_0006g3104 [Ancylostoma ceylanicum]